MHSIENKYGSLDEPDFGFIAEGLDERPYAALVEDIGKEFELEESTDPDDDHGFHYALRRGGRAWALNLSLVGPYAVLARSSQAWDEILTPATADLSAEERTLVDELIDAGFRLLDRAELERPVPLKLFTVDPDEVRVYHALFTDTSILPWDKETMRRLGLID
jgi:hypothetical protein